MTRRDKHRNRSEPRQPADLLREVIEECLPAVLTRVREEGKLGDWIKMIELHRKIAPENQSQKKLWDNLERIRQDFLKDKKRRGSERTKPDKNDQTRS